MNVHWLRSYQHRYDPKRSRYVPFSISTLRYRWGNHLIRLPIKSMYCESALLERTKTRWRTNGRLGKHAPSRIRIISECLSKGSQTTSAALERIFTDWHAEFELSQRTISISKRFSVSCVLWETSSFICCRSASEEMIRFRSILGLPLESSGWRWERKVVRRRP